MRATLAAGLQLVALGGGSASALAGALALGVGRRRWPLAPVLLPEVAPWTALPGLLGVVAALGGAALARRGARDRPSGAAVGPDWGSPLAVTGAAVAAG